MIHISMSLFTLSNHLIDLYMIRYTSIVL